jgi:hypothetical protein
MNQVDHAHLGVPIQPRSGARWIKGVGWIITTAHFISTDPCLSSFELAGAFLFVAGLPLSRHELGRSLRNVKHDELAWPDCICLSLALFSPRRDFMKGIGRFPGSGSHEVMMLCKE